MDFSLYICVLEMSLSRTLTVNPGHELSRTLTVNPGHEIDKEKVDELNLVIKATDKV